MDQNTSFSVINLATNNYVVFAGTPTWTRTRNRALEEPGYIPLTMGAFFVHRVGLEPTQTLLPTGA